MSKLALIVEDSEDIAIIFTDILVSSGFETEIAADGQVALDRLAEVVPDLIILDLHLPHVSGDEVLRHVRSDDRFEATKVIVVTADGSGGMALSDEADMVLLKPVAASDFRMLVQRVVG